MNNLSSYCGLVDAKIRASDKDLPVQNMQLRSMQVKFIALNLLQIHPGFEMRMSVNGDICNQWT